MNVVFPDIVLFANLLLFLCVLHAKQTKILERVESKNKIGARKWVATNKWIRLTNFRNNRSKREWIYESICSITANTLWSSNIRILKRVKEFDFLHIWYIYSLRSMRQRAHNRFLRFYGKKSCSIRGRWAVSVWGDLLENRTQKRSDSTSKNDLGLVWISSVKGLVSWTSGDAKINGNKRWKIWESRKIDDRLLWNTICDARLKEPSPRTIELREGRSSSRKSQEWVPINSRVLHEKKLFDS